MAHSPDAETRTERYRQHFMEPWQNLLQMLALQYGGNGQTDELAGVRQAGWYLPEQLTTIPSILTQLEAVHAWEVAAQALARGMNAFADIADQLPFETVTGWLLLADPERANPAMRGYTGAIDWAAPPNHPRFTLQFDTADEYTIPRLPGATVHELNHLVRLSLFPWNFGTMSVASYCILEGLAESFAGELFGSDLVGYYVTDFDEADLDTAKALVYEGLDETGFDVVRGYIFGDPLAEQWGFPKLGGMPAYGGYAIGYRIVQAYLERTGNTVAQATQVPTEEIIAESLYFE